MEIKASVKYGKLKKAIEAMSKEFNVKVGLLAGQGGDTEIGDNMDLAGLGAVHEFGATIRVTDKMRGFFYHQFGVNLKKTTTTIVIPARSFLELPITQQTAKLKKYMVQHFGGEGVEAIEYWIAEKGDLMSVAQMLGASAVEVIHEAFQTNGFGNWQPNSPLTIAEKGSAMPLLDTGNLWQHIHYEVENG